MYSKAHTKDAKKWLDTFEKNQDEVDKASKSSEEYSVISEHHFESKRHTSPESNVPVLVCMTFADRLLAEMLDEDGKYNPAVTRKDIAKHFEVSTSHVKIQYLSTHANDVNCILRKFQIPIII